jgi:dihydropteroate synthase
MKYQAPTYSLNCQGRLLDLQKPQIMGILNLTPDSFFGASRAQTEDQILSKAQQMLTEGAAILDLGGHSTRPGASAVSEAEEADRVLPAVELLARELPQALLSIDTFRASVARQAVEAGAVIINDVAGGNLDPAMFETAARCGTPYVLMHSRGDFSQLTQPAPYSDLVMDIVDELQGKIHQLRQLGVWDIVVDLGFGFGKTLPQNYVLLRQLDDFSVLNCPLLVGVSRKSMIWKKLGIRPEEALPGTAVLHAWALERGANLLRVHDVKPAAEAIALYGFLMEAQ